MLTSNSATVGQWRTRSTPYWTSLVRWMNCCWRVFGRWWRIISQRISLKPWKKWAGMMGRQLIISSSWLDVISEWVSVVALIRWISSLRCWPTWMWPLQWCFPDTWWISPRSWMKSKSLWHLGEIFSASPFLVQRSDPKRWSISSIFGVSFYLGKYVWFCVVPCCYISLTWQFCLDSSQIQPTNPSWTAWQQEIDMEGIALWHRLSCGFHVAFALRFRQSAFLWLFL